MNRPEIGIIPPYEGHLMHPLSPYGTSADPQKISVTSLDKGGSMKDNSSANGSSKNEVGSKNKDPEVFRKNMFGLDNLSYNNSKLSNGNKSRNAEDLDNEPPSAQKRNGPNRKQSQSQTRILPKEIKQVDKKGFLISPLV